MTVSNNICYKEFKDVRVRKWRSEHVVTLPGLETFAISRQLILLTTK